MLLSLSCLTGSELSGQSYSYDSAGRLIRVAYPDGRGIAYAYDAADNLTSSTIIALPPTPTTVSATRTAPGEIRVSWESTAATASGFVIMRKSRTGGTWIEIATVGGNARQYIDTTADPAIDYVYRLASRDSVGTSAFTSETRITSNASLSLRVDSGGAGRLTTLATEPFARTGYASIEVDTGSTPYGTAVFRLTQGGVIVSEAAVPASPPTKRSRIFIEYRANVTSPSGQFQGAITVNTGFAVANTGSTAASTTYRLKNASGQLIASGTGAVGAGEHFAKFINELSSVAAGFSLPAGFETGIAFGTLDIDSDQPLSVMALRLTYNQRGEGLFTSTPVADLNAQPAAGEVSFPQLADGGGYSTAIVLLNPTNQVQGGRLEFRDDAGAPLAVRRIGGASAASFDLTIAPDGLVMFETDGSPAAVRIGWARWIPTSGTGGTVGSGMFRFALNGIVVTDSGVPSTQPSRRVRIYIDKSSGRDTGIAIANPGSTPAAITINAYQLDGKTPVGNPTTLDLGGGQHTAKLSSELIPALASGFTGVMELSSAVPFAALTLRLLTNSRGDLLLTTFPVADQTRPAPGPMIFPQIADGGGYETELILLGPITASLSVISFFDDQGKPLPAGRFP